MAHGERFRMQTNPNPICSVEGCERPRYVKGFCSMHYARQWNGRPLGPAEPLVAKRSPTCSIDGCDRPHASRTWCQQHYVRWLKYGDPLYVTFLRGCPPIDRFVQKIVFMPSPDARYGPCWIWTASTNKAGYGTFRVGQSCLAYKWSWEYWFGPVPNGKVLDHFVCDTPKCCAPLHLRPVTRRENTLRGNTIAARNLAKTHCKRGHEFTPATTRVDRKGGRTCMTCVAAWEKEYRRKN